MANKTYSYKVALLGAGCTGKSSIMIRFVKGQFTEYQEATIGAAFMTQTVSLQDCKIRFEIWDTAGRERFSKLAPMYYTGASAVIVVYDITDNESFHRAKLWIKEVQRHNPIKNSQDPVFALVGNKIDRENDREVSAEDAKKYADDNNHYFIEISAKKDVNITKLFMEIAKRLYVINKLE
eukprot:402113_1